MGARADGRVAGEKTNCPNGLTFGFRRVGRAVEGTGLENRQQGNLFVSSNLTPSATLSRENTMRRILIALAACALTHAFAAPRAVPAAPAGPQDSKAWLESEGLEAAAS
jgi:hypothetical protein